MLPDENKLGPQKDIFAGSVFLVIGLLIFLVGYLFVMADFDAWGKSGLANSIAFGGGALFLALVGLLCLYRGSCYLTGTAEVMQTKKFKPIGDLILWIAPILKIEMMVIDNNPVLAKNHPYTLGVSCIFLLTMPIIFVIYMYKKRALLD
ncbi:hypothetical protein [Aquitalea magnusonii]|uniref:Uncharacterized protein n=1 Tax=Aquitalea magnusonii TaxID=332411 RepID=A0A318JKU1_9NEIS|nr:hypothetical protein [Aquitalea magnusonii]PXX48749.1 hypothetical protein DFR38_106126 [Aquitalea magnusonii]